MGVAAPKLLVYYAYKVLRHPILRAEAPGLLSNSIFLCSKPSQSIKDPFFSGSCVSPQRLYHFQTSSMIRNPPGFPLLIFFNNVDLKYSPMEIPFVLPILSHSNNWLIKYMKLEGDRCDLSLRIILFCQALEY